MSLSTEQSKIHERIANRLIFEMVGLCKRGEMTVRNTMDASGVLFEGSDPYVGHLMKGRVTLMEFARLVCVPKERVASKM